MKANHPYTITVKKSDFSRDPFDPESCIIATAVKRRFPAYDIACDYFLVLVDHHQYAAKLPARCIRVQRTAMNVKYDWGLSPAAFAKARKAFDRLKPFTFKLTFKDNHATT